MKQFKFVIKDENGIHARPAGLLVKKAGEFSSSVMIQKGEKSADAKRLFAVMGLAAKKNDELTFTIDGEDEEQALSALQQFCDENL
ncbi:HPr family phosphocarrier protein [Paludicola sp. MB14-C6]|uniref:HPr family phosphocarrier protein n=1 Tax=Paludihabitans sp. MB14-C6 TaxID=3070656 RepID=UPI0027DB97B7|nr:HPr family phosphocarrier protein [Paludicola sp. MB14-C6]WMJ23985.1 HPr family phosphocarrier protein [Paludicola sp. MB14-C6]